ncbi:MAG: hypothetical protein Q4D44_06650 [Eubacteriales bacterium]|nr:hypothetical protein [Eubacteriales bacterium]
MKICKRLCLLFAAIFLVFITGSLTAFAVYADGGTQVIAHIETSESSTATDSSGEDDGGSILTGEDASVYVFVSSVLLVASVFVIYVCMKIDRSNSSPSNE